MECLLRLNLISHSFILQDVKSRRRIVLVRRGVGSWPQTAETDRDVSLELQVLPSTNLIGRLVGCGESLSPEFQAKSIG